MGSTSGTNGDGAFGAGGAEGDFCNGDGIGGKGDGDGECNSGGGFDATPIPVR